MNEHDLNTTGAIATALAKVQAELPKLERDRTVEVQQKNGGSYSYSYVTLANLSDAILPLLAKNGLAFAAMPGAGADGKMAIRYALLHESGERLDGEFPISGEGGIQMVGGRITYARRYVLAALVGVAADEDDESRLAGEASSGTAQRASRPAKRAASAPPGRTAQRASASAPPPPLPGEEADVQPQAENQRKAMHAEFKRVGINDHDARVQFAADSIGRPVESTSQMTSDETAVVIEWLKKGPTKAAEPEPVEDNFTDTAADQPPTDPTD